MSRRRTPRFLTGQPLFAPASECPMRKRGYASQEDARRAIVFLQGLRAEGERTEVREYRCQFLTICGNWHLTSDSQLDEQLEAG